MDNGKRAVHGMTVRKCNAAAYLETPLIFLPSFFFLFRPASGIIPSLF